MWEPNYPYSNKSISIAADGENVSVPKVREDFGTMLRLHNKHLSKNKEENKEYDSDKKYHEMQEEDDENQQDK
jgi:hypothetical protein